MDSGDGIVKCVTDFLGTKSKLDVEFTISPEIELKDWRGAQLAMVRENIVEFTQIATVKISRRETTSGRYSSYRAPRWF